MEGLSIIVRINKKLYNEVNSIWRRCANVSAYCKYPRYLKGEFEMTMNLFQNKTIKLSAIREADAEVMAMW